MTGFGALVAANSSAADVAQIAAALFAAVAAGAAWRTVALDHKRQREARQPNVAGGVGVTPSLLAYLMLANAGPGLAVALAYMAVIEGRAVRGIVGTGLLAAGQEVKIDLGRVTRRGGTATVVWLCYDVGGNEHLRSADHRHRVRSREDVLARESHDVDNAFRAMYPDVAIPKRPGAAEERVTGDD